MSTIDEIKSNIEKLKADFIAADNEFQASKIERLLQFEYARLEKFETPTPGTVYATITL